MYLSNLSKLDGLFIARKMLMQEYAATVYAWTSPVGCIYINRYHIIMSLLITQMLVSEIMLMTWLHEWPVVTKIHVCGV